MHTFYTNGNREAFKKIRNGTMRKSMLKTLQRIDGEIESELNKYNVYELFELDTKQEFVNYLVMRKPLATKLTREFKNLITDTYRRYEEEKKRAEAKE